MTRKTNIPDLKISPDNEDANNLRSAAREMLETLKDMKNRALSATDMNELKLLKMRVEILFGRTSLTGGLTELTDLLLKLTPEEEKKKPNPTGNPIDDGDGDETDILTPSDIKPVQWFLEQKKQEYDDWQPDMETPDMEKNEFSP